MIHESQRAFRKSATKGRKRRDYRMIDLKRLVDEISGIPHPSRIGQAVSELRDTFLSGGHMADDFDAVLFDQDCADLRELPPAILEARELAVPCNVVFDPGFCISQFNRRLVHSGEDVQLIEAVERVFTNAGLAPSISDHSASLRALHRSREENAKDFYRHLVCGRHRSALLLLRRNGPVDGLTMRECLNLVLVQTLLFNARDLQANIALVHQAMAHPVPSLLDKADVAIRANAVQTIVSPMRTDAGLHFSNYKSPAMRQAERRERLQSRVPGEALSPIAAPAYKVTLKRLEPLLQQRLDGRSGRDLVRLRSRLDGVIPRLSVDLAATSDGLPYLPSKVLGITRSGHREWFETSNRTAVATRYSGLTPVECLAVSVCRFVQSISFLSEEFEKMALRWEKKGKLLLRGADGLSPFSFANLPRGSRTTVRGLIDHYRRTILRDPSFGSKSGRKEPIASFDRQGEKEIDTAANWLETLGGRRIEDFHGDINSERRTYHLLDVLPEVRLTR